MLSSRSFVSLLILATAFFSVFPARRMRSLPISQIFLYPALYASDFSSVSSGNWTMINLRCPPSSALSCITAWAVVAEPEKKSRITSVAVNSESLISSIISCLLLGLSNGKSISLPICDTSISVQFDVLNEVLLGATQCCTPPFLPVAFGSLRINSLMPVCLEYSSSDILS